MRKLTALILCLAMLMSFAGCAAKVEVIRKNEDGEVITEEKAKTYEEMTTEEKFEYHANNVSDSAIYSFDNEMLAPALDTSVGLWGYISSRGEWVIEPTYSGAFPFSEGFAPVLDNYSEYNIINSSGEKFLSHIDKKTMKAACYFTEGFVPAVLDSKFEQTKLYVSTNGVSMIMASNLPKTNGVSYQSVSLFSVATPFINGMAVVMRRTNASVIEANKGDRELVANKGYYQSAYVIDAAGEIVTTLPAGYDVDDNCFDSNDYIVVRDMTNPEGLYGICDVNGNIISECKYIRIEHCEGDYYLVCNRDGFWGYLYRTGKEVIECKYQAALPFSEGYAAVCEEDLWGVIDTQGEYVIEPSFDEFHPLKIASLNTNIGSAAFNEGLAAVRKGAYWALIDTEGNIIRAAKGEDCPYKSISGRCIVFSDANEKCGLLDLEGNEILAPAFGNIGLFGK